MTQLSDQKANEAAVPAVFNVPNTNGVVKCKYFSGTVATADGLDCASLNDTLIANTAALNRGVVLTQDELISATVIGDVIVNDGTYYGYFLYI